MAGQVLLALKRDRSDEWCCNAQTFCWTVHSSEFTFFGFAHNFLGKQGWLGFQKFKESWAGNLWVVWGGKERKEGESALH